jgi:hypothetical protein
MWRELRDYWLPLMLYVITLFVAGCLLVLTIVTPYVIDYLPPAHGLFELFVRDMTVRHTSIAVALGLFVNAFVFFRPNKSVLSRKSLSKKPPHDTMAGA